MLLQLDNVYQLRHNGNPHDIRHPACDVMHGIKCTFRQAQTKDDVRKLGIVASNTTKVMVRSNLWQIFDDAYRSNNNPSALERIFDEHLKGKRGILSYNKRVIEMDSIVCTENENTTFPKRDSNGNEVQVSYKDHIRERFNVQVLYKELCVIKDRGGAAFLPQFINITATNEMQGNDVKDQNRSKTESESPQQTMQNIIEFVKKANQRSAKMSFVAFFFIRCLLIYHQQERDLRLRSNRHFVKPRCYQLFDLK